MFASIIGKISGWMYGYILIILLVAAGFWFTFKTKFVQVRLFTEGFKACLEKPHKEGGASSFQTLMVSTGSRVGTGNIIGISTAICMGGYGAVFWMWFIAFLGCATAYIESALAQIYKKKDSNGHSYGGPAYYITAACGNRSLAVLFAISLIATYAGGFNMLAAFNLRSTFEVFSFYQNPAAPLIIRAIVAGSVGYCILGGGKRIMKVSQFLVPIMGAVYIVVAAFLALKNISLFPSILSKIFADAFNFQAIFGGFSGSCLMYGIKRGLYSNEAGVGSAPNAAAYAEISHPAKQGLVQMISVFLDSIIICTCTAVMCLASGIVPTPELAGAKYVQMCLSSQLGTLGPIFITFAMITFAFSTLVGNLFYVDNCLTFILQREPSKMFNIGYRIIAVLLIFFGAGLSMGLAWDIGDVLMGIMCIINVPVIIVLGNIAVRCLDDYVKQRKEGKNPVFHAADIGLNDKLDYWQ